VCHRGDYPDAAKPEVRGGPVSRRQAARARAGPAFSGGGGERADRRTGSRAHRGDSCRVAPTGAPASPGDAGEKPTCARPWKRGGSRGWGNHTHHWRPGDRASTDQHRAPCGSGHGPAPARPHPEKANQERSQRLQCGSQRTRPGRRTGRKTRQHKLSTPARVGRADHASVDSNYQDAREVSAHDPRRAAGAGQVLGGKNTGMTARPGARA